MPAADDANARRLPTIDRLIHEPARYNVMALLYVVTRADFLFVQNQTSLTPGNLSSHLSKLEAAGYLTILKKFVGKTPRTYLKLTAEGREAFEGYRDTMKELFTAPPTAPEDARGGQRPM